MPLGVTPLLTYKIIFTYSKSTKKTLEIGVEYVQR